MSGLWLALAVGGAGALGALGRVLLDDAWSAWRRRRTDARTATRPGWPWALLVVNVLGSLILGLAWGLHTSHPGAAAVIGAGFCGGLTTFSTWVVAIAGAACEGRWGLAASVLLSQVLLGGLAAWAGLALGG